MSLAAASLFFDENQTVFPAKPVERSSGKLLSNIANTALGRSQAGLKNAQHENTGKKSAVLQKKSQKQLSSIYSEIPDVHPSHGDGYDPERDFGDIEINLNTISWTIPCDEFDLEPNIAETLTQIEASTMDNEDDDILKYLDVEVDTKNGLPTAFNNNDMFSTIYYI